MKKLVFFIAVVAFFLGLIVHIFSVAGIDVKENISFIWVLHLGIFPVWGFVMFLLMKKKEFSSLQQSGGLAALNPFTLFRICFRDTPRWMIILIICCFIYAVINFVLYIISGPASVDIRDGQYTLESNGKVIAILTEARYHYHRANQLRGFSGHWIAFYGAAIAILYPMIFSARRHETDRIAST